MNERIKENPPTKKSTSFLASMPNEKKRKRPPCDAQWCLDNINDLSVKSFATAFSMADRVYAHARYKNILAKYAPNEHKKRLLEEHAIWKRSMDEQVFWKDMKRKAALRTTEATCSEVVNTMFTSDAQNLLDSIEASAHQASPTATAETTPGPALAETPEAASSTTPLSSTKQEDARGNEGRDNSRQWALGGTKMANLFKQYRHEIKSQAANKSSFHAECDLQEILALSNILFLAPGQHSDLKMQVFGCQVVDSLCRTAVAQFMDNQNVDFSMEEAGHLAAIVDKVQTGEMSAVDTQVELLLAAKNMVPTKAAVTRGVANLVVKLPLREIVDMDSLGETEMQATYIDPVLAPLFSNPAQNVVLRWANKNEEITDIRPDAVISTVIQSKYGRPLGFGEVKPGNSSTDKHSLCMDTMRLAVLSKDMIGHYGQDTCFAFQVDGFRVSFFMIMQPRQDLYLMVEVATTRFPSSLDTLDVLTTRKNLCTLARVSSCFWKNSGESSIAPLTPARKLPISTLYQMIDKSHHKTVGTTSRY
ncbi:hypothetical protein BCR43DRAFT_489776, partial [Syncephalastrum racemosum]